MRRLIMTRLAELRRAAALLEIGSSVAFAGSRHGFRAFYRIIFFPRRAAILRARSARCLSMP
jgi:hypothetical protein